MITCIFCNWKEFDEYELDKKYNLIDFGEDEKHPDYKSLYDLDKDISIYVR